MRIVASAQTTATREGQAAVITAVKTAARAVSHTPTGEHRVTVVVERPEQVVLGGPSAGELLGDVLEAEDIYLTKEIDRESDVPTIVVGEAAPGTKPKDHWIVASWSGWTAHVSPVALTSGHGLGDGNVLAAIGAGALAVAENFFQFSGHLDAGHRAMELDLWAPEGPKGAVSPTLQWAPAQWWLLGLGHLGQAYAHVLSWLEYATPGEVEVVLQDVQLTAPANHSTGLLTPLESDRNHKTRLVGRALDLCGLRTTIIERLMNEPTLVCAEDMHVALIGVDNIPTRRQIDAFGWRTSIDVGLGTGADDFDGMTLHRFPGRSSRDIPAWRESGPQPADSERSQVATEALDACGVARLNGVAVGASFVGAIAAVAAIAEVLRPLHGSEARSVLTINVREGEVDSAFASSVIEQPVTLMLRHEVAL